MGLTGSAGTLPFPVVLGHEGIARIEKLGAGVSTDFAGEPVAEGDLIFWSPTPFCGRCYACSVVGDPPCEPQGLNSVFDTDVSTLAVIAEANRKLV